jgi:Flp pilus assembly protein TadG
MLSKMKMRFRNDKGVTLLMVAASLTILLGMCALGIDLVAGYLARVQCQRAADAAALAGAQGFVSSTCTSTGGCAAGGLGQTMATSNALSAAAQNPVMGLAPTASTVTLAFAYPDPSEPQITVTVHRDAASGDPMPTMFAKIFGINTMNISATATAEAYNGQVGVGCIRPFLVPNCDPNFPVTTSDTDRMGHQAANTNCPCGVSGLSQGVTQGDCPVGTAADGSVYMSYYIHPSSTPSDRYVLHNDVCNWSSSLGRCTVGDIGAPWVLHNNLNQVVPSQWYTIAFSTQSGNAYSTNISQCAPEITACGSSLDTLNGKKVGPTNMGIEDLIHAKGQSTATNFNQGQDKICSPTSPGNSGPCTSLPFLITRGSNSPYPATSQPFDVGQGLSDSLINVVIYNGAPISPGGSSVMVDGYMSLFIQGVDHSAGQDNVYGIVTQIGACASGPTGPSTNTPTSSGGSFIPIRLIRTN